MCGNALQSQRHRSPRPGGDRRSRTDRRGDERLRLLFAERFALALRPRANEENRSDRSGLAIRREAVPSRRQGKPGAAHRGGSRVRARLSSRGAVLLIPLALGAAGFELIHVDLDFIHANSPTTRKYLPETMGGGVALLDYDNDGRLDIFFVNGAKIEDPMLPGRVPDKSDRKYWNRLYHQNPDGSFTDVTEKAGLT